MQPLRVHLPHDCQAYLYDTGLSYGLWRPASTCTDRTEGIEQRSLPVRAESDLLTFRERAFAVATKVLPSPSDLRQLLDYSPETGKLTWRRAGREAFAGTDPMGYRQGRVLGCQLRAHRVIMAMVNDHWPVEVDHINGVRSDNRLANLREVTHSANMRNAKRRSNNTSGTVGVSKLKSRWRSEILGQHLGVFDTYEEAVAARKRAEAEHEYHPNHGRTDTT